MAQFSQGSQEKWNEYRTYKNEYKKRIEEKKYQSTQRKFDRVKGDMKGTWNLFKSLLNNEVNEIECITKLNGESIENKTEMANEFNKYFIDSIKEINGQIEFSEYIDIHNNSLQNKFELTKVSISEVKKYLKEMKNKDKRDEFNISANILSDSMMIVGDIVTTIINNCIENGIFPEILKKSTIIPIEKISGTKRIEEFRPINTLPCFERLIERIVYDQLIKFVEKSDISYEKQSGFRNAHSCESAINLVLNEWKKAKDDNCNIIAVFLDLKRAFETLDLMRKYGIEGNALKNFTSYLQNRRQIVRINNVFSNESTNELGVPQGSILGPFLFIIYINDLPEYLLNCEISLFADDTLIYIRSKNIDQAIEKLNCDLNIMADKLNQYKLKLNVNKTKAIIILGNKQINQHMLNIKINDEIIEVVNEIKYLGIIIDNELNFNSNTEHVQKKNRKKSCIAR